MNRFLKFLAVPPVAVFGVLAPHIGFAATVRTATEPWVTNKVAQAAADVLADAEDYVDASLTNYYTKAETDVAIAAATPADYDTVKDQVTTNAADIAALEIGKQDAISDLETIRSGAALGATALQEHQSLTNYFTKGESDGRYLQSYTETDPTIYSWAKSSTKPNYAYSEISNTPDLGVYATTGQVAQALSGKLGNTGDQTLDGTLTVKRTRIEENKIVYDVGAAGESNLMFPVAFNDYIAVLSDIYAAVRQIAPDFTAKAYVLDELCSYNGVVYRCKSSYTATASSAKPNADTTHWEAKKVSELFVPWIDGNIWLDSRKCVSIGGDDAGSTKYKYGEIDHDSGNIIKIPSKSGTLALLQNLAANYSTSSTYPINKLCVYDKKLYRCTTAITTAEAWTAAHWTEATVEDVLAVIRSALDGKAPLASPAFTGTPTAPNLTDQSADGQVANKKYVDDKVAGVSVTPLSGQTFDFATMQGIFAGVKACIEALGGSVTNFPAIPVNE